MTIPCSDESTIDAESMCLGKEKSDNKEKVNCIVTSYLWYIKYMCSQDIQTWLLKTQNYITSHVSDTCFSDGVVYNEDWYE